MESITFVVPVGNEDVYEQCFLSSPLFEDGQFQIIAQREFPSAGAAFNDAIDRAENDLLVFCHQDVLFPGSWHVSFTERVVTLEREAENVGIMGCVGITYQGVVAGHVYRHNRELVGSMQLPESVRTLDEMLISFRKSSSLRFDEDLPAFFYYAVDMCLQAESEGLINYAIDAPCFHQAKNRVGLPSNFYKAQDYMIRKWHDVLPVETLSGRLCSDFARPARAFLQRVLLKTRIRKPWWVSLPEIDPAEILQKKQRQ